MTKSNDSAKPGQTRRGVLGLLGAGSAMLGASVARAAGDEDEVLTEALVLRDPDNPIADNVDGDISIVEWFDYQCPY